MQLRQMGIGIGQRRRIISLRGLRHSLRGRSSESGAMADLARWKASRGHPDTNAQCESKHPMNKRQLIDGIRQLNQTAQPEFLLQFDEESLDQYLKHL